MTDQGSPSSAGIWTLSHARSLGKEASRATVAHSSNTISDTKKTVQELQSPQACLLFTQHFLAVKVIGDFMLFC